MKGEGFMEYKKENSTIYLRINRGENILETITKVCKKENVCGGYFQGIGACDTMALSSYIPEQNVFADHEFSGMLEMISLMEIFLWIVIISHFCTAMPSFLTGIQKAKLRFPPAI